MADLFKKALAEWGVTNQEIPYDPTSLFGVKPVAMKYPEGYYASVKDGVTDRINYEPDNFKSKDTPNYLMAHEMEHILQNRGANRYGDKYFSTANEMAKNIFNLKGYDQKKLNTIGGYGYFEKPFRQALADPEVVARLKQLGLNDAYTTNDESSKKTGYNYNDLDEVLASLAGWEQANNKDITQDKLLRKKLFRNDPAWIEAYKAVTGLRQERLDAKDLAPYTVDKEDFKKRNPDKKLVDYFLDIFKDTTK